MTLDEALDQCGLIAILRGVTSVEVIPIAQDLYEIGFRVIEVPLNSPDPFTSIRLLAENFRGRMVTGAGTVLAPSEVEQLCAVNGKVAVAPNCNSSVIVRALDLGVTPIPGVFTPTEAFAAVEAGARHLKLFPAEACSPATIKAWRAVLPAKIRIFAVGGVTPSNMKDWLSAGATGFGIGSSLYRPGMAGSNIRSAARHLMTAWQSAVSHLGGD